MQKANFIPALISLVLILTFCQEFTAVADDGIFRREADAFLSAMPENLQKIQTEAIRRAIGGDTGDLAAVRNSRNIAPELPDGVTRTDVTENLSLFRSEKFANDTIPLLIYLHGGGWTIGSINSCSRFCAALADSGIAVLAADYRLAPEHRFPAGLDDCIEAVKTAADSLDSWKCRGISIGGDSSGGNLAIATALSSPGNILDGLVAFYPVTRAYPDNSSGWEQFGLGYGLDSELMVSFNEAYTADIHNPLVSPAEATDDELRKLPPVLLISAERDILADQGREFIMRLGGLGLKTEHHIIPGSVHLFITVPGQKAAFDYSVEKTAMFIKGL